MKRKVFIIAFILLLAAVFLLSLPHKPEQEPSKEETNNEGVAPKVDADSREWIIAWENTYDPSIEKEAKIMKWDEQQKVTLVTVNEGVDQTKWSEKWKTAKGVRYLQPNFTYKVKVQPNDSDVPKQKYLEQIHAKEGWEIRNSNTEITIAVIDTGVDLNHPDLKNNLVPGINMLNEEGQETEPMDDNGHGTQVAGIVAAEANNGTGVSGILWKAKIMPIKAMDSKGEGKDYIVGRSIYEGVNRGASIILLSLGDPIYSLYMKEAVDYAEKKGVLVVAATGNDYERVNYPAAFPTVVSVGAVNNQDVYMNYSNSGPEVTVSAPGEGIYTTNLGGKYTVTNGTSMAAPQVAGLAALILAKYPDMTPAEVRDHIFQTAVDVGEKGWDSKTGFGRIDIERALKEAPGKDFMEPNNVVQEATPFPINTERRSFLSDADDIDWYKIYSPYAGTISIDISLNTSLESGMDVTYSSADLPKDIVYHVEQSKNILLTVPKGTSYLSIKPTDRASVQTKIAYEMNNDFVIAQDAYEDNDSRAKAAELPYANHTVTGNFHDNEDEDWFVMDVPRQGKIKLTLSVETIRIDPVLTVFSPLGEVIEEDEGSRGGSETVTLDAKPGKLYIKVSNYYEFFVNGQYDLNINVKELPDPNEPNDQSTTATSLDQDSVSGNIGSNMDLDWYTFTLHDEELVNIEVKGLPVSNKARLILYDESLDVIDVRRTGMNPLSFTGRLQAGKFFARVDGDEFNTDFYEISLQHVLGKDRFMDIKDHWAKDTIIEFAEKNIISGYSDLTFKPDQPISRAEVATVLAKMLELPNKDYGPIFPDINRHWAKNAIGVMVETGYLSGYPDGKFYPDRAMSRAEAAALINVLLTEGNNAPTLAFSDVPTVYWAYKPIMNMVSHQIVSGYSNGTFRPKQPVTRAELLTMLRKWEESR